MTYTTLMYLHLATVIPAAVIGLSIFLMKKGTRSHKVLGRVYCLLMLITSCIVLFMPAKVGGRFLSHFGWIHILCIVVFVSSYRGIASIKKGNIKSHQFTMSMLYMGAILIAGFFAFTPGRYLHGLLFG